MRLQDGAAGTGDLGVELAGCLCHRIGSGLGVGGIPGVTSREAPPAEGKAPAASIADMDSLPVPDYAPFFDQLTVRGRRPILALLVEIDQIFFHCPKAFMRSQLWQPESWRPDALPSHAALVKTVQETPETLEELEEHYALANYTRLLY